MNNTDLNGTEGEVGIGMKITMLAIHYNLAPESYLKHNKKLLLLLLCLCFDPRLSHDSHYRNRAREVNGLNSSGIASLGSGFVFSLVPVRMGWATHLGLNNCVFVCHLRRWHLLALSTHAINFETLKNTRTHWTVQQVCSFFAHCSKEFTFSLIPLTLRPGIRFDFVACAISGPDFAHFQPLWFRF